MQQTEWDAAFGEGVAFVDTSLFDRLRDSKIRFIDGGHDVFGDGSVRLVFTPGHTAGHQVLLVSLDNSGKILLSGDL
jgi:glyoxylase-like metal-dependent hydrolase (beta-lactamase superfamily II)